VKSSGRGLFKVLF